MVNKYRAKRVWVYEDMPYLRFGTKPDAIEYAAWNKKTGGVKLDKLGKLIKFDSQLEHNRWLELLILGRADEITDIKLQPTWELQPGFRFKGKKYQAIKYSADFTYYEKDKPDVLVIEDVKSEHTQRTKEFRRTYHLFVGKYLDKLESGEWDFRIV